MLGGLPGAMGRATDPHARIACLEDFFVHARLLLEFLLVCPANSDKDFSARDFGWHGHQDAEVERLKVVWVIASRQLVHFSRERVPESVYDLEVVDTSAAGLQTIAGDILALFDIFVTDMESRGIAEAAEFRCGLHEAMNALSAIPNDEA
jgi:hypothetical protein